MPQFNQDPLPLRQWLTSQPKDLCSLFDRARQYSDINRCLHEWAQEPWLAQIKVVNIRKSTLVIFSSSASALVPLRWRQKALLEFLNQRFHLSCTELEAKVRPASKV